jgi:hypothetical protein
VASLFTASLRPRFRALAAGFVPETTAASAAQWATLEATTDRAMAARPPSLSRQLALLIRLIDLVSWIRYGRGVAQLDAGRRTALLEALAASRLLLVRRGIWGLRTLVMLGWYSQPDVTAALGYRASPAGWGARQ